ncbi:hypothetical protein [Sinorhizobium terangae]|uniref:hypothetical protein n=1 Tax=Sinorhizobium terangae TaxID=110322 RepID=UPI0024B2093B|nr:hypothetical protein [Sinorhizobium terangae]WFU50733.1 hypothetical protein QA637_19020 [Sinorhizobium terangae]
MTFGIASSVELSGTFQNSTGDIVYLEAKRSAQTDASPAYFADFRFGQTKLADIRSRFGSAGMLFKGSPPAYATPDGGVAITSNYEVADTNVIASFVSKVSPIALVTLKNRHGTDVYTHVAKFASLDTVIISDADYFKSLRGSAFVFDEGYHPIAWQEASVPTVPSKQISLARIKPAQLPAYRIYSGPINAPDFTDRDSSYRSFQTRIADGMANGPNFAGEFAVIQIGCGTGCSIAFVASVRTGEVFRLPLGGEDNMYLSLEYQLDSRLMIAQWAENEASNCYVEFLGFKDGEWTQLLKHEVGSSEQCYNAVAENLRQ